ncbi:pyridoxal phosphate-dependent transferase [Sphaerosporella brunnea]|uniref:Pyridoxal phosphate-dependent transferase n=1 Tax=Sphaerosporella brunnea TaxID=1250544 RepID=A0A5J5F9Y3_9PEZI|nr:pyridoxal phosphate-dependent transferase [Sphaerosporella brunnea]
MSPPTLSRDSRGDFRRSRRSSSLSSYCHRTPHRVSPSPPQPQPDPPLAHIDLQKSCQSPRLLPAASIAYACRSVLTDPFAYADSLLPGPPLGSTALRTAITDWLAAFYGEEAIKVEDICITGGASQGLAAILQKFSDPVYTRSVWLVAPSPRKCVRIFEDAGLEGKIQYVAEDANGIELEALARGMSEAEARATAAVNIRPAFKAPEKYPKIYKHLIVCQPAFRDPTGATIPLARRKELLTLARRYDALIVADDAADFFSLPDSEEESWPLRRLVDLDRETPGRAVYGNAVSSSSFSTLVAPGCRVGWLQGAPEFVETLGEVGTTVAGGAPSQLAATFVGNLLTTGTLQGLLRDVLLPTFSARRKALVAAAERELVPLGAVLPRQSKGGWWMWVRLPGWCDGTVLCAHLKEEWNILVEYAGGGTFVGMDCDGCLRLCLAWEEAARLEEGVKRIAEAMGRMRKGRQRVDLKDLLG